MARFVTFVRLVKPVIRVRTTFTLTSRPSVVDVRPRKPDTAVRLGFRRIDTVCTRASVQRPRLRERSEPPGRPNEGEWKLGVGAAGDEPGAPTTSISMRGCMRTV